MKELVEVFTAASQGDLTREIGYTSDDDMGLLADKGVETDSPKEVQADLESVMQQYIRDEHDVTERAKDMLASRGRPTSDLGKMKRLVAEQRKKLDAVLENDKAMVLRNI